jgi:hypothetical protein
MLSRASMLLSDMPVVALVAMQRNEPASCSRSTLRMRRVVGRAPVVERPVEEDVRAVRHVAAQARLVALDDLGAVRGRVEVEVVLLASDHDAWKAQECEQQEGGGGGGEAERGPGVYRGVCRGVCRGV